MHILNSPWTRPGAALAALVLLSGCETVWQPVAKPVLGPGKQFTAQFPTGWVYRKDQGGERILVTRDGVLLQTIAVSRYPVGSTLPQSGAKVPPEVAPEALGDLLFQETASAAENKQVELESAEPCLLDGCPGVRLRTGFRVETGLRYQSEWVAAIHGGYLVVLSYTAPVRHYYAHDREAFARVVEDFRFEPEPAAKQAAKR